MVNLSEGLIFAYQQPHRSRIYKYQQWHRKAELHVYSINTIAINVLLLIE